MITQNEQFEYWWNASEDWVEEPNKRRGGISGVLKFKDELGNLYYIKRQEKHIYRSILHPFGQQTLQREFKAYMAFKKADIKTPDLIYYGLIKDKAILVTKALKDFISFEDWLNSLNNAEIRKKYIFNVLKSIAKLLTKMHKQRLQHNCIYPKHIFINLNDITNNKENIDVALIDLEKSRKRFTAKQAALHDTPQIKRHTVLSDEEWNYFVEQYEIAFNSSFPDFLKN